MAAGGPLPAAGTAGFLCTPLAMHGGNAPPLVVPADAAVTIGVTPGNAGFVVELDGFRTSDRGSVGDQVSVTMAGDGIRLSLREWVNSGLMTFFFFVLGLEARREFGAWPRRPRGPRRAARARRRALQARSGGARRLPPHRRGRRRGRPQRRVRHPHLLRQRPPALRRAYDIDSLAKAVHAAGARATLQSSQPGPAQE
jgi:Na+/H+ antiporter 1